MKRAFDDISNNDFNKTAVSIITAYAAATIVYGNGQRSGVINNLTIEEYRLREEGDNDMVVIPCIHHKTAAQGLALLAITEETEDMLDYYYNNIRTKLLPSEGCEEYLFLRFNGMEYDQVYRRIKEALSTPTMSLPPPGLFRILISSEARRHLDEFKRRRIVKHLSHSAHTSDKYYEFEDASDAAEAYATISALSAMRRWQKSEITEIETEWPMSGDPPTVKECREFLKRAKLSKTTKEIICKWHQLKAKADFH